jgi:hypothetical protein
VPSGTSWQRTRLPKPRNFFFGSENVFTVKTPIFPLRTVSPQLKWCENAKNLRRRPPLDGVLDGLAVACFALPGALTGVSCDRIACDAARLPCQCMIDAASHATRSYGWGRPPPACAGRCRWRTRGRVRFCCGRARAAALCARARAPSPRVPARQRVSASAFPDAKGRAERLSRGEYLLCYLILPPSHVLLSARPLIADRRSKGVT